jgi:AcrR family transcriptional regulator
MERKKKSASAEAAVDHSVRERLLVAAARVFARKGYAAAAVEEIVAEAAVTKPVLYYWFRSKEGLFLDLMQQGLARFTGVLDDARGAGGSAGARLAALCGSLLHLVAENPEMARLTHSILYGPPQGAPPFDFVLFHTRIREAVLELLAEGIAAGEFRPGEPERYVWAVLGALSIAIETHLVHPELAPDTQRIFASAFDVVLRGIASPGATLKETPA